MANALETWPGRADVANQVPSRRGDTVGGLVHGPWHVDNHPTSSLCRRDLAHARGPTIWGLRPQPHTTFHGTSCVRRVPIEYIRRRRIEASADGDLQSVLSPNHRFPSCSRLGLLGRLGFVERQCQFCEPVGHTALIHGSDQSCTKTRPVINPFAAAVASHHQLTPAAVPKPTNSVPAANSLAVWTPRRSHPQTHLSMATWMV